MSTETHTVADDQVRSAFKRWQNLEQEKARVADDLKELFAEQKALGHDTKAMRAAFRLKVKLDEADPAEAEHEALVDTYLAALEAPRASRAYARENIEQFDRKARAAARTSEAMDDNKAFSAMMLADGLISEEAHAENVALSDAVARKYGAGVIDAATGEIIEASGGSPTAPTPLATREAEESVVSNPAGSSSGKASDFGSEDAGSSPALASSSDQPLTGGDHGEVADSRAAMGEGDAYAALPTAGVVLEYVPPTGMKRLPFASCFPDHSKAEYERLEKDIAASRVRQPIIRQGNVIIDGFARYTIARKYGFAYPVQEYTGNDLLLDVIEWQRAARNFTPAQERKIAADLAKESPHRANDIMAAFGLAEALEDVA